MDLIAQAAQAADAVPAWVGALSGSAVMGVLVYYLVTTAIPKLQEAIQRTQDRFHEQLDKERDSRERMMQQSFQEQKAAIESLINHNEKKHEQVMAEIRQLPNILRAQV
jgi:uncharacterized membrane protein YhiD involved in acid resistance